MKKILHAVAFVCLAIAAKAQNLTTVTGSNLEDLSGAKLATGQICFQATDASDNPTSFQAGGGGQVVRRPYCSAVTAGVITSFSVPNPALTVPAGINYRVTVKDTTLGSATNGQEILRYKNVAFVGAGFNFDAYGPTIGNVVPLTGTSTSGSLAVNGDLSVTGSFTVNPAFIGEAPFAAMIGAMNMGQSAGLQVIGDSTGNDTDEWVYLTGLWLASKFPAYTVKDYVWNDSTQDYDAALSIQSGSGGERYVSFAAGVNGARIPDDDITLTSGDVDVRCKLAPDTWRPAAVYFCFRKYTSPYRVIRLGLQTTGKISFEWSSTGSDSVFTQSTVAATDFGANNAQWIRATFQPGTSAVNFYTSADNVTYTQVGTQVTTSAGSLFVGGNGIYDTFIDDWTIGGSSFNGKVFKVELHQGVNGPVVSPRNIDAFQPFDSNATFGGAPELNIVNASMPGAGLSYFTDTTRQKTLMTNYSQESVVFSLSHNETRNLGKTEMVQYASLLTTVKSKYPLARVVVLTQNPRLAIAGFVREQTVRRQQIMSWAVQNGYAVIDTFKAFYNDPRGLTTLINNSDGIHPTGPGKQLWADTITAQMQRSMQ